MLLLLTYVCSCFRCSCVAVFDYVIVDVFVFVEVVDVFVFIVVDDAAVVVDVVDVFVFIVVDDAVVVFVVMQSEVSSALALTISHCIKEAHSEIIRQTDE